MFAENQEPVQEKNKLEELKGIIKNAPRSTEEEFLNTTNSWLACFTSNVFAVEIYLDSPQVKGLLSVEQNFKFNETMEELKMRLDQLKELYSAREDVPPEDIKQELLNKLNIFR